MASRSPRRKSPRRKAAPRRRRQKASPSRQHWDDDEDEEEVAVPFPVYIYRPSMPVPIAVPSPDQPQPSPEVQNLKNKLQLLLKEHLEQQLAPKQDKGLLIDLQLRLLHLMQQPIQNQYEIKIIQAQLEQQLKKKLTPKENMERYRQMQLLLEEIDQVQKQEQSKKQAQPTQPTQDPVQNQTELLLKQILDAVSKKAPTVETAAAVPGSVKPAASIKVEVPSEATPVIKKEGDKALKKEGEKALKKEGDKAPPVIITYVSTETPMTAGPILNAGYTRKRDVYNVDGNGFFRALGFELLNIANNYKYGDLLNFINEVVIKDAQFNEDVNSNCVLDFKEQIVKIIDGDMGWYMLHSLQFDKKVLCAMKAITLAYIKHNPDRDYSPQTDILKNDKPIDMAVMTLVCKVFKANVSIVSVENDSVTVKSIKGDADRQAQVDAYIHQRQVGGNTYLCLLYKK